MRFHKIQKTFLLVAICINFGLLSTVYGATQSVELTPIADDIAVYNDSALNTETPLAIGGSSVTGSDCLSQYETFLKFDLQSIPSGSTLTNAKLTLRSTGFLTGSTAITLKLFGSTVDGWTQGSGQILWASKPSFDFDLASTALGPVAAGTDVVFNSTSQFVSFLQNQLDSDQIATLAIKAIACNNPAARQYVASLETTGSNAIPAKLTLEGTRPNSVSLSTFTTDNPAPTWPLYAGLAALAVIAAAGVAWSRRRATQR